MAAMAPGTVKLNIFAWNQKLTKDGKDGQLEKAMQLFQQMQQEGMSPDKFTFVQVIKACAGLGRLQDGRLVHKQLIQSGYKSDVFVCNSLVDMYVKCGSIEEAWTVFEKMPSGNVVTWTTMILGHVQCRQGQKALELFEKMQQEGVQPDFVTFVGVLNACASILALEEGRCKEGVQPNDITFICLLSACSHAGLVDEGMRFYASMVTDYIISPKLEHYTCIVDLLGCAGHLQEAENIVMEMPWKPHVAPGMALIGTCRIHGNVEMAKRIAKRILEMELENAAGYVVLSNIYAAAGNRHLCENVERQRMARGVKSQPARTWIEVNNEVHTFVVDNQEHPVMIEIHAELQDCQGLCMMQEEKAFHLCHHSEKLAIAFGLINTAPGSPLRIRKNLQVCEDCHTSTNNVSSQSLYHVLSGYSSMVV
ncbi:unnamed protein product [Sphagnum troendelagicum]